MGPKWDGTETDMGLKWRDRNVLLRKVLSLFQMFNLKNLKVIIVITVNRGNKHRQRLGEIGAV